MISIAFDPATSQSLDRPSWDAWQTRAAEATGVLISEWERGQPLNFSDTIWIALRNLLLQEVFHGKCTYCESKLDKIRIASGQMDHYRPKGRVYDLDDRQKRRRVRSVLPDGTTIDHPGYFWLAYDWHNLLPSCKDCNAGPRGKLDYFPTANGHRFLVKDGTGSLPQTSRSSTRYPGYHYPSSVELNGLENPLFLHPYFCDPLEHLSFEDCGEISSRQSMHAARTIFHLNLDNDGVTSSRHDAQLLAEKTYLVAFQYHRGNLVSADEASRLARNDTNKHLDRSAPFSAAVTAQVRRTFATISRDFPSR